MTEQEFEAAIEKALDLVPRELLDAMDNVVIIPMNEPDPSQLQQGDVDEDGLPILLGLYEGFALTERDAPLMLPDQIFIFKGPLERMCSTHEELVEEIAVTVIHEIAHHFGIDDDRLHKLGWAYFTQFGEFWILLNHLVSRRLPVVFLMRGYRYSL